jgi:hypothetical protein
MVPVFSLGHCNWQINKSSFHPHQSTSTKWTWRFVFACPGTAFTCFPIHVKMVDGKRTWRVAREAVAFLNSTTARQSMWTCPTCNESHGAAFAVCWRCGTSRDGTRDTDFVVETDPADSLIDAEEPASPTTRQFSLSRLFQVVTLAALLLGISRGRPNVLVLTFICIAAANLLGLVVGLLVTYGLGLPNDGSLEWNTSEPRHVRRLPNANRRSN